MALTATASPLTRECIIRSLFMIQPKVVYVTPQKKNNSVFRPEKNWHRGLCKEHSNPNPSCWEVHAKNDHILHDQCSAIIPFLNNILVLTSLTLLLPQTFPNIVWWTCTQDVQRLKSRNRSLTLDSLFPLPTNRVS